MKVLRRFLDQSEASCSKGGKGEINVHEKGGTRL